MARKPRQTPMALVCLEFVCIAVWLVPVALLAKSVESLDTSPVMLSLMLVIGIPCLGMLSTLCAELCWLALCKIMVPRETVEDALRLASWHGDPTTGLTRRLVDAVFGPRRI